MDESAQAAVTPDDAFRLVAPLRRIGGWLKLLGGVSIGLGLIQCVTVVGLVIGWLPIWIGVLAWRSAVRIEDACARGDRATLDEGIETLARTLKLQGVWMLVALVATALYACALAAWFAVEMVNSSVW